MYIPPRTYGPDPSVILARLESGNFTLSPPLCYPFCNNARRDGGISGVVHFFGNFEEESAGYSFTSNDDAFCAAMFSAMRKNPGLEKGRLAVEALEARKRGESI